jgi:cullin-associated NEDD8-dissociated protein 1
VRKRAIVTLSHFVPLSAPELSAHLLSTVINPSLELSAPLEKQRTTVNLVAAIARASPQRLASNLGAIVPGILRVVDLDDEELREGALQVIASFLSSFSPVLILSGSRIDRVENTFRSNSLSGYHHTSRN